MEEKRGLAGMKRHPGWPIIPLLLLNDTRLSVVRSRGPIFVRWPRQPNFLLTGSTPLSDVAPRVYDFCAPPSFVQVDRWRNEGPHRSSNSRYIRACFSLANPDPRFLDPDPYPYTSFRNYDDWRAITFLLSNRNLLLLLLFLPIASVRS